jgi:hypothetical protein
MDMFQGKAGQILQIGPRAGDDPDFHSGLHQRTRHGPADKPGRAGYERFHA